MNGIFKKSLWVAGFAAIAAASGCGGGAGGVEAGNPSQLVIGSLAATPDCGAEQAVATDSSGNSTTAPIASDCSFELQLAVPQAYHVDFLSAGGTVASMAFNNSSKRFLSPAMNLTPGDTAIFLDRISFKDGDATPFKEPSVQNDQDADGLPDLFDDDDDGDGIADEDEVDCDLDGIIDDFDGDVSGCAAGAEGRLTLEVSPRNGEGTGAHGSKVKKNADVRIRFSCPIDTATVLASSLTVAPQATPAGALDCSFSFGGANKQLICTHSDFEANTLYAARLEGVRCEDGSEIPAVTWSWRTR